MFVGHPSDGPGRSATFRIQFLKTVDLQNSYRSFIEAVERGVMERRTESSEKEARLFAVP